MRKNNNFSYFPEYTWAVLLFMVGVLFFVYGFNNILFLRPQGIHQWRQCDCLSFALNYYNHDATFFHPAIQYLGKDGTGKTASGFPGLYFIIAKIWKITGYHEFTYRIIILLIAFSGLFALTKTVEDILKDSLIAVFVAMILFTSTIFVYYSNNFLMNVPALSMALVALYFFYKFYQTEKNRNLYLSVLFFTIGGLLKITALMGFVAIFGIFALEWILKIKFGHGGYLFKHPRKQIVPFLVVILFVASWYFYAAHYNANHNSGIFLIGILPIWKIGGLHIQEIIHYVRVLWLNSYHSEWMQVISVLLLAVLILYYKKVHKFLGVFTFFLTIGFFIFLVLFFQVFAHHDYYLTNQLILMISIFTSFFYFLKTHYNKIFKSLIFRFLLLILLVYNVKICANNIHNRYHVKWENPHLTTTITLEHITPYLRSLGVKRTDPMLVEQDGSFDISLYLMDQKGYTTFGGKFKDSAEIHQAIIHRNLKYLLVTDSNLMKKDYLKPFLYDQIGKYKNNYIFKLK